MNKRWTSFLFAAALVIGVIGCSGQQGGPADQRQASNVPENFKIGIMTGTVSQNEEEFRAAQQLIEKYGDRIKHVTYPDNFMQEQETVIAQATSLAADRDVKVIVLGQAVPGSVPAARKIREMRPDILIGFVEPHEDPAIVNETVDIAVQPDQLSRARTIVDMALEMGAKQVVHYSFPRHMSQELLAERRDLMKQTAKQRGIPFYFVTAPDPMSEGGLSATQQFMLEDVPRQVSSLGKDTAFFSTNCGMQEPLIKSVLTSGGFVPEQCCPSPTHGYPGALGIAIPPDKKGNIEFIHSENRRVIHEHGMEGHFGTWVDAESMVSIRAVANLLVDAVANGVDYKDMETVKEYLVAEASGAPVEIKMYDENEGNQYLFLLDQIVY